MKYFIIAPLILFSLFCTAQNDTIGSDAENFLIKRVTSFKNENETLRFIDSVLESKSKKADAFIAALYKQKAFSLQYLNKDSINKYLEEEEESLDSIVHSIVEAFKKAVDTCNYCKPLHVQYRYWFTKTIPYYVGETKKDLDYLKAHGYKENFSGIVVGANYTYNRRPTIGLTLALTSDYHPIYKLTSDSSKTKPRKILYRNKVPLYLQTICFNFNKYVYSKGYEASFSFLKLTSPFYIDPLQIGTLKLNELENKNRWFWRPEIGFGFGPISISTGYNVFFNKTARKTYDKMVFKVNLSYPLFNKKSNE